MLLWALLNLQVLLRTQVKRAMRGRAVHACSPIDAALDGCQRWCWIALGLLVSYMTLAPSPGAQFPAPKKASSSIRKNGST